jgi:hypothetical protein
MSFFAWIVGAATDRTMDVVPFGVGEGHTRCRIDFVQLFEVSICNEIKTSASVNRFPVCAIGKLHLEIVKK